LPTKNVTLASRTDLLFPTAKQPIIASQPQERSATLTADAFQPASLRQGTAPNRTLNRSRRNNVPTTAIIPCPMMRTSTTECPKTLDNAASNQPGDANPTHHRTQLPLHLSPHEESLRHSVPEACNQPFRRTDLSGGEEQMCFGLSGKTVLPGKPASKWWPSD
jgi:hypothetical protein